MIKRGLSLLIISLSIAFSQSIEPFLMPPFSGEYRVGNVFDHNYPFPFEKTGGDQLTWWGDSIVMGYDGHAGYDWLMPEGTRLLASAAGEVVFAGSSRYFCKSPSINQTVEGISVQLRHKFGDHTFFTSYSHMSEVFVKEGQFVEQGRSIGRSGNTGCSTAPHLHFSVKIEQEDASLVEIDPYGWHGSLPDPWAKHVDGTVSYDLWLVAPVIFRELTLPDDFTSRSPVWIKRVRYMGADDNAYPNNEFIELKLNTEVAPTGFYLGGHRLVNDAGDVFEFPKDFYIYPKKTLRIYSGYGQNTEHRFYLESEQGIWSDSSGCVRLQKANGQSIFNFRYHQAFCD